MLRIKQTWLFFSLESDSPVCPALRCFCLLQPHRTRAKTTRRERRDIYRTPYLTNHISISRSLDGRSASLLLRSQLPWEVIYLTFFSFLLFRGRLKSWLLFLLSESYNSGISACSIYNTRDHMCEMDVMLRNGNVMRIKVT